MIQLFEYEQLSTLTKKNERMRQIFVNTPFFNKQFIFDPRHENCLSFLRNRLKKLFSNCLVDSLLTSIV